MGVDEADDRFGGPLGDVPVGGQVELGPRDDEVVVPCALRAALRGGELAVVAVAVPSDDQPVRDARRMLAIGVEESREHRRIVASPGEVDEADLHRRILSSPGAPGSTSIACASVHVGLNLIYLTPRATGGTETVARELIPELVAAAPQHRFTAFVNRDTIGRSPAPRRSRSAASGIGW
ncbi:MAG: hypothetical protein ACXVRX_12425, partial [Solirubrobacteraceae bacterium]